MSEENLENVINLMLEQVKDVKALQSLTSKEVENEIVKRLLKVIEEEASNEV